MELLYAIEQLAPVRQLRLSFVVYPLLNALHIAAIGALWTCVLLMDLALLGVIRSLPREAFVAVLRRVALGAFAIALPSGLALFSVQATTYAGNTAFLFKLGLIALAALNFAVFAALDRDPDRTTSTGVRLSAAASIVLWSATLVAGRFIGFV